MIYAVLVVLLVLLLLGGLGPWQAGPYWGTGYYGGSAIGVILVVLLILALVGRL
jgi:hypothetical protein